MNILKASLRALATTTVILGLAMSAAPAHAFPRSAYPSPKMTYVAHPPGFPDSAEVVKHGSSLTCKVPLGTAKQGDVKIRLRTDLVPLVRELMRQTEAKYSYNIRPADTGAYNCRFIGGTRTPSNHAYGRAIDINWNSNPRSKRFASNLPPEVVSLWIRHGFYWGGHYKSTPDTMHFEYVGTRSNIDEYYRAAVKEGGTTNPPTSNCPSATRTSYPTVKQGSSGTAVRLVQCKLKTSGAKLNLDGVFGPATKAAAMKFQKTRGLPSNGVVNARTWTALLAQGSTPTLKKGSQDSHVTRLQQALRARGQKLDVDGIFGRGTDKAVRAYQKRTKLSTDGIAGKKTWAALQAGI